MPPSPVSRPVNHPAPCSPGLSVNDPRNMTGGGFQVPMMPPPLHTHQVIAMSGNLQAETEPEQMHGGARWFVLVIGSALLFGPTLWVLWPR